MIFKFLYILHHGNFARSSLFKKTKQTNEPKYVAHRTRGHQEKEKSRWSRMRKKHNNQQKQPRSVGSSSIYFSDIILGQLLSKQGIQADHDFDVPCKGSRKHLYAIYLATPKNPNASTRRAMPTYSTTTTTTADADAAAARCLSNGQAINTGHKRRHQRPSWQPNVIVFLCRNRPCREEYYFTR